MIESKIVKDWQAEGELRGELRGEVKGKVGTLLHVLTRKFQTLPEEVATRIRATTDTTRLDFLNEVAALSDSLEKFRTDAGI